MATKGTDTSWIISPRPNAKTPTYLLCGLRFAEANRNHSQLNETGKQIFERISSYNWPQFKYYSADPERGRREYAPIVAAVITEDDKRRVSFIASQTLHYLRSALDHLVFNASWIAQGSPQDHTQFPVCDTKAKWNKAIKDKNLGGMSSEKIERIEQVQPFNGVDWTENLRVLNNADKHKMGVEVSPSCCFRADLTRGAPDPSNSGVRLVPLSSVSIPLLLPALGRGVDATPVFTEMFLGITHLLNLFFADEGIPLIQARVI